MSDGDRDDPTPSSAEPGLPQAPLAGSDAGGHDTAKGLPRAELRTLLQRFQVALSALVQADKASLFLNDEKTEELYSVIGAGGSTIDVRYPNHVGIAGEVFTSGRSANIPDAQDDPRFNASYDRQTAYRTRSLLAVPVVNAQGKRIGVIQVSNKADGPFSEADEQCLTEQAARFSAELEAAWPI